jgi:hypothetical protein
MIAQLKWQNTCLASMRLQIQTPIPANKQTNKKTQHTQKKARGVAQVGLTSSKCEALSSNPITTKRREK